MISLSACSTFSRDNETAGLYVELAQVQLQKGHPAVALSTLMKAEKIDPNNPQLNNQFGLTYGVFEKHEKAVEYFRKAVATKPDYSEARNNYARALIEVGKYKEARDELELVTNDLTYRNQASAFSNVGLSYLREGKYKDSLPFFQKSLRLSKNCLTYSYYGRALYELKDYRGAIPVFDVALPLCKKINFDEAHYYGALTYFKSGDKIKGVALMNETILHYTDGAYQDKAKSMLELMKLNKL